MHPPNIEVESSKFTFAVAVDDDSSSSNDDNPPHKVVPTLVPEDDEPEVVDAASPVFDPDNSP